MNIRLAPPVYETLQGLAASRGTSMNKAIEEAIAVFDAAQRKERLRSAFARLAEAEHEVDFAFDAQAEVALAQE